MLLLLGCRFDRPGKIKDLLHHAADCVDVGVAQAYGAFRWKSPLDAFLPGHRSSVHVDDGHHDKDAYEPFLRAPSEDLGEYEVSRKFRFASHLNGVLDIRWKAAQPGIQNLRLRYREAPPAHFQFHRRMQELHDRIPFLGIAFAKHLFQRMDGVRGR